MLLLSYTGILATAALAIALTGAQQQQVQEQEQFQPILPARENGMQPRGLVQPGDSYQVPGQGQNVFGGPQGQYPEGLVTVQNGGSQGPQAPITILGAPGSPSGPVDCGQCPPGQLRVFAGQGLCGPCVDGSKLCMEGFYWTGSECAKCPCDFVGMRCKGCHVNPTTGRIQCDCNPNYTGAQCQTCAAGCVQRDQYPYDCFKPNGTQFCTGASCQTSTYIGSITSYSYATRSCSGGSCPGTDGGFCPGCFCKGVGCPCDTCNFNNQHVAVAVNQPQCPPCYHQHTACPPCNQNCQRCDQQLSCSSYQQSPCGSQQQCWQPGGCQPQIPQQPCQCPPPCPTCCGGCNTCPQPPTSCPPTRPPWPTPPTAAPTTVRPTVPPVCEECCDPRGTFLRQGRNCLCKTNVMDQRCDTCKPGFFGLSEKNSQGCSQCFCSGVTGFCSEVLLPKSTLRLDSAGPTTLFSWISRQEVRDSITNYNGQIIHYFIPATKQTPMYWRLPDEFSGGLLTSYGATLTFSRSFTTFNNVGPTFMNDVIIYGAYGHQIYWASWDLPTSGNEKTTSVALNEESQWHFSTSGGAAHVATRKEIMTVLANVQGIYIRATLSSPAYMNMASLRGVTLTTGLKEAVVAGAEVVHGVEQCACPEGYFGLSCESCSPGFYRDYTDIAHGAFGTCRRCPCGRHSTGCKLEHGQITCICKDGYYGPECSDCASLSVKMEPIQCRECFDVLKKFTCSYSGSTSGVSSALQINLTTVPAWDDLIAAAEAGSPALSPGVNYPGVQQGGSATIVLPVLRNLESVICQIRNKENNKVLVQMESQIVGEECTPPSPPPTPPTLRVSTEFVCLMTSESADVTCYSESRGDQVYWAREGFATLPPSAQDAGQGTLRIQNPLESDSGTYVCISQTSAGTGTVTKKVAVQVRNCWIQPQTGFQRWRQMAADDGNSTTAGGAPKKKPMAVMNVPKKLTVKAGEKVKLVCQADIPKGESWKPQVTLIRNIKGQSTTLGKSSETVVFNIEAARPGVDGGKYVCAVESVDGKDEYQTDLLVETVG